jgi:hypothetical protein
MKTVAHSASTPSTPSTPSSPSTTSTTSTSAASHDAGTSSTTNTLIVSDDVGTPSTTATVPGAPVTGKPGSSAQNTEHVNAVIQQLTSDLVANETTPQAGVPAQQANPDQSGELTEADIVAMIPPTDPFAWMKTQAPASIESDPFGGSNAFGDAFGVKSDDEDEDKDEEDR